MIKNGEIKYLEDGDSHGMKLAAQVQLGRVRMMKKKGTNVDEGWMAHGDTSLHHVSTQIPCPSKHHYLPRLHHCIQLSTI